MPLSITTAWVHAVMRVVGKLNEITGGLEIIIPNYGFKLLFQDRHETFITLFYDYLTLDQKLNNQKVKSRLSRYQAQLNMR